VNSAIFSGANSDGLAINGARQYTIGQKWIARENVSPPAVGPVGSTAATFTAVTNTWSNPPTVTVAVTNSFSVGDDVVVTGMTNTAFNTPYARILGASSSSLTYGLPYATTATGTSGGGTITRANQYSLALAANTTYYYRIGNTSISGGTCVASPITGSFTTGTIPNGNTWQERFITDNNGLFIEPTIPEDRTASFVDPLTGSLIHRVSMWGDSGGVGAYGWDSGFFSVCSKVPSGTGFYHCIAGLGDSGVGGLYAVNNSGTSHWLGFVKYNYTDSAGHTCCNSGIAPYLTELTSSNIDSTDPNKFYAAALTNGGNQPAKTVIVSFTFTGSDTVDAGSGANMVTGTATALTPDPSNTLTDQMQTWATAHGDTTFSSAKWGGCTLIAVEGNYGTGYCDAGAQGSVGYWYAINLSTGTLAAMGPTYKAALGCRWCGQHGVVITGSQKWTGGGIGYLGGAGVGQFQLELPSAITASATSFSVTSPKWHASTVYGSGYLQWLGIIDSNGNLEEATVNGGTSGSSAPTWNTTSGGTTNDGTQVWINSGAATGLNEPQNVFPYTLNTGGYWSYLMNISGGANAPKGGDMVLFLDGTKECMRVLTVGSSGNWTSVVRGVYTGYEANCAAGGGQAHAAGAPILVICDEAYYGSLYVSRYWDFIDDPAMTDTTNTYFVEQKTPPSHGYARENAPEGRLWMTYLTHNGHNPFITSDFTTATPDMEYSRALTFAGMTTDAVGVTYQDYANWDFENAAFKDSALGSLFFVTGGGAGAYGGFTKVVGTTSIYKYNLGSTPFTYKLPYNTGDGAATILDISGVGSALTDGSSTPTSCVVVQAGECWSGSAAGEIYGNIPVVDAGSANYCNNASESGSTYVHDWCMMNGSTYGNALAQMGLLAANLVGTDVNNGAPIYGAGLSRRLVQQALGNPRNIGFAPHAIPDGSGALFRSCAADTYMQVQGYVWGPAGCNMFVGSIPPQPTVDGIDRTNYETLPIAIGTASGASYAELEYGYEENEPTRAVTRPATINYYCTQYRGTCYWASSGSPTYSPSGGAHLSLSATSNLQLGVPQRVLYYNILYYNSSNVQVGTSGLKELATDPNALTSLTNAPTISPASGSFASPPTVSISDSTPGATICYTTNGTTPTGNGAGACTNGTTYTASFACGALPCTVQAIGTKSGLTDSGVASATYTLTAGGGVASPIISPASGSFASPPAVTITDSTSGATICYTTNGSTPTANGAGICTNGITYASPFTPPALPVTIQAIGSKSGLTDSGVASASYLPLSAVANPVINPASNFFGSPPVVTITDSTAGATICYTTNGVTPTTNGAGVCTSGSTYTGAFTSPALPATIKAIGTLSGYTDSSVVAAAYSLVGIGTVLTPGVTLYPGAGVR
jgi:hypothetical protein